MTRKLLKERRQAITGVTASGISLVAELISSNVDLLTEILLRLPARSLIRFKCVSKHWLSLISHSQFASNHSSRNPRPSISGLYLYFYSRILSVSLLGRRNLPSLSFLDGFGEQSPTRVLHFCNGLLLCYKSHSGGHIYRQPLIVCNPTTKEYMVTIQQAYLGHGVFWNGAIHWLTRENSLVRFAVDAEEVIIMPNPQTPKILTPDKIKYFGESGDCLILIQSKLRLPLGFRILELDKNYCGWIVKCRVNLRPLIATFPDIINCAREVLRVSKGDKERDFTLVLAFLGKIVSYDLTRKTWDVLYDGELGTNFFKRVYPIIEILSPV